MTTTATLRSIHKYRPVPSAAASRGREASEQGGGAGERRVGAAADRGGYRAAAGQVGAEGGNRDGACSGAESELDLLAEVGRAAQRASWLWYQAVHDRDDPGHLGSAGYLLRAGLPAVAGRVGNGELPDSGRDLFPGRLRWQPADLGVDSDRGTSRDWGGGDQQGLVV